MSTRIETDLQRFRQIVRGKVRDELRRHLGQDELFGKQGKHVVAIPVPHLDLPHVVHDPGGTGVGQGEGEAGAGTGEGNEPGKHLLEAEFTTTVGAITGTVGSMDVPQAAARGHRGRPVP